MMMLGDRREAAGSPTGEANLSDDSIEDEYPF